MLNVIEKDKAKELLDGYFQMLSVMGNVKRGAVDRFIIWLFILDFVDCIYYMLTEDDYNKINEALFLLFAAGCCLMPYQYVKDSTVIGSNLYMGDFNVRVTEINSWHRVLEDGVVYRRV